MCGCCRRLKQALWTARAQSEMQTGLRNWFGTLTLSPAEQFQIVTRCRSRLRSGGTDFDTLSASEQFAERMTEIGKEVTLWLKRVRKESGASLRYLLVAEAHKSGEPHLHVLVHEGESPVRYRTLANQWKLGHCKFNLVDGEKAARYVCKYISKSALARVRASLHYGKTSVSEKWSEAEWKENSPREHDGVRKALMSKANGPLVALTDHTGGKKNGIIDEIGVEYTTTVEASRRNEIRQRVEHTRPDAESAAGLLQAAVKQLGARCAQAAVSAVAGEAVDAAQCTSSNARCAPDCDTADAPDRNPYPLEKSWDIPF